MIDETQILDIATAWAIARRSQPTDHHERCSYRVTSGGLLCDCGLVEARWQGLPDPPTTDPEPERPKPVTVEDEASAAWDALPLARRNVGLLELFTEGFKAGREDQ